MGAQHLNQRFQQAPQLLRPAGTGIDVGPYLAPDLRGPPGQQFVHRGTVTVRAHGGSERTRDDVLHQRRRFAPRLSVETCRRHADDGIELRPGRNRDNRRDAAFEREVCCREQPEGCTRRDAEEHDPPVRRGLSCGGGSGNRRLESRRRQRTVLQTGQLGRDDQAADAAHPTHEPLRRRVVAAEASPAVEEDDGAARLIALRPDERATNATEGRGFDTWLRGEPRHERRQQRDARRRRHHDQTSRVRSHATSLTDSSCARNSSRWCRYHSLWKSSSGS